MQNQTKNILAKITLYSAGIYNILWGTMVVLIPNQLFQAAGMIPPRYPELLQCIGMMVAVFGVAYLAAANDPFNNKPVLLAGLLGRILGPIGFILSAMYGVFPWIAGLTIITNDLIWIIPFSLILWHSYKT